MPGDCFSSRRERYWRAPAAAEATLFDLAGLECGSLSIAASQTVGNYWLPPILHRYRTLYPKIAIELKICNTLTAADMARAGVVDFAIVEGEICDTSLAIGSQSPGTS